MLERFTLETGYRVTTAGPMARTPDGRLLWCVVGPEFQASSAAAVVRCELYASDDEGRTWKFERTILRGAAKEMSGVLATGISALVTTASKKIILFGAFFGGYSADHDPAKSRNEGFTMESSDSGRTWSEPRLLPTGERYLSSVLSASLHSSGRIIFPFGFLTPHHGKFAVSAIYSDDDGEHWRRSGSVLESEGGGFESGACEPSVVELPDGRLWMLMRVQTGVQWESFSADRGETWEKARPSRLLSSNSPAVLCRLSTGQVAVAWNNSVRKPYGRRNLTLAVTDDGQRFHGFREVAHAFYPLVDDGGHQWHATYPYLCEAPDGRVLVAYNYGNWGFCAAKVDRIDLAWLQPTSFVEDFRDGRGAWCYGLGGNQLLPAEDDGEGAVMQVAAQKAESLGAVRNFPLLAQGEMRVEGVALEPEAFLLWHDSFLEPGLVDQACLRARFSRDGDLFLAAGEPSRTGNQTAGTTTCEYSYLAYPVNHEIRYPARLAAGGRFVLSLLVDVDARRAEIAVNDGPRLALPLGDIFGLSYFGVACADGGKMNLRKLSVNHK